MKYRILFLMFFSFAVNLQAQDYRHSGKLIISGNFTTDPLSNIYSYTGGDIFKYGPDGKLLASYSNREFGEITHLDASNPMKILAVFGTFSKAVILDASLSANFTMDLSVLGSPDQQIICLSKEQGFWIYDRNDMTIKRLNETLSVISEGTSLRQVSSDPLEPSIIFDTGAWVLLFVNQYGVLVFDRYGTYFKTIPVTETDEIQILNGNEFIFKDGDGMISIDIQKGITKKFRLPQNDPADKVRVEAGHIFIHNGDVLNIYSY
jgi:hypothetical protein